MPKRGVGIAVLTNLSHSPVLDVVTWGLLDRLLCKEPKDWAERCRAEQREVRASAGRAEVAEASSLPTRPLCAYAGDYDHLGYGRVTIADHSDHLTWRSGDQKGPLAYCHHETFLTPVDRLLPERPSSAMPITFAYNRVGDIDRLSAPLDPAVADIVFKRAREM